jgi:predicted ABC-type ATPase
MPDLYIISGCNGAGKTTASYTVLPEILNCNEFVNADNIAAGLSPFNPESVALEAGRIMLQRIDDLLNRGVDFAFETTLATRSYVPLVKKAQQKGYTVTLLYFWLNSPQMAIDRVAVRVSKGGHNIPADVIERRYYRGIKNLIDLYIPICDNWLVINSTKIRTEVIAQNLAQLGEVIINNDIWNTILSQNNDSEHK